MLIHVVLLDPDGPEGLARIEATMPLLADLCGRLSGVLEFRHGPNRDFEGRSQRYAYGFELRFADRAAHRAYDEHPEHRRLGAILIAATRGGTDGIFVADLDT